MVYHVWNAHHGRTRYKIGESKGEYLKGEYTQERESLVKQLEIRLMAERERERERERVNATASNQIKS